MASVTFDCAERQPVESTRRPTRNGSRRNIAVMGSSLDYCGLCAGRFGSDDRPAPRRCLGARIRAGGLPDGGAAIDHHDLAGGDLGLVGGEIDRHVGHVDRVAETQQMLGAEPLDILGTFQ